MRGDKRIRIVGGHKPVQRARPVEAADDDRFRRTDEKNLFLGRIHCCSPDQTSMLTGISTNALKAASSFAPSAPSTTRWSHDSVTLSMLANTTPPSSFSIAWRRAAPTARMVACGGLMMAENSRTPYMPRLDMADDPP